VSRLVSYEQLIDTLREHLRSGASGLITGVSENKHSFQIGLKEGKIVMLTYRIFKGAKALDKFLQMDSAKIIEHLNIDPPALQIDLPDTGTILTTLSMEQGMGGNTEASGMNYAPPASFSQPEPASSPNADQAASSGQLGIHPEQLQAIKSSAMHYFGPIGAMVCDEHLTSANLSTTDLPSLLTRIANEVGASEADTRAFIDQVTL
jgi:hypothetical protein